MHDRELAHCLEMNYSNKNDTNQFISLTTAASQSSQNLKLHYYNGVTDCSGRQSVQYSIRQLFVDWRLVACYVLCCSQFHHFLWAFFCTVRFAVVLVERWSRAWKFRFVWPCRPSLSNSRSCFIQCRISCLVTEIVQVMIAI